jgi:hypothetical protein
MVPAADALLVTQSVATAGLLVVTLAYVVYTARLAGHAKTSASSAERSAIAAERSTAAAERAATAAERGLLLQLMPLVFGHKVQRTGGGRTEVTMFGFGSFPAFQVMVVVRQDDREGSAGPIDHHDPSLVRSPLDLTPGFQIRENSPYSVEVTYYDAMGTGYRTTRQSLLGGHSLTRIERYDDEADDWVLLVG